MSERFATASAEVKPTPLKPILPAKYGPTSTPAIRYAVTEGSLNGLKRRVIKSPAKSATETESKVFTKTSP